MWVEETTGSERYSAAPEIFRGGLRLEHTIPLPVGTTVNLTFTLPGDKTQVAVSGEIVSAAGPEELRMGVKFVDPSPEARAQIDAFLARAGVDARMRYGAGMIRRLATSVLPPGCFRGRRRGGKPPKQMEPRHMLKPAAGEGYFDDVFAIDADGKRIALIRTDAATFSKLEMYDAVSGKPTGGFDLPDKGLFPVEMELLAGNAGGGHRRPRDSPDDMAPLSAFRSTARASRPARSARDGVRAPAGGWFGARAPADRVHAQARDEGRGGDLHGRAL